MAHRSDRTLKRFIRCTNYDECGTSYPLPQRGKLKATGETCPDCGAPVVEITTSRGPWRICVNMDCPGKARAEEEKAAKAASRGKGRAASSTDAAAKAGGSKGPGQAGGREEGPPPRRRRPPAKLLASELTGS